MKQVKLTLILIIILTCLVLPAAAVAQSEARLYLSADQLNLQTGQQSTVDVFVEEVNAVYGTEFHLRFDTAMLEVVEMSHGDFLAADPDKEAFVLQNEFDNRAGTIDYAVSLLNPAPPAAGNGVLLHITFQGKAEGPTTIEFVDALFGTQTGEEVTPFVENAEIMIGSAAIQNSQQNLQPNQAPQSGEPPAPLSSNDQSHSSTVSSTSLILSAIVIVFMGFVILIGLIGFWFWQNQHN